MQVCRRPLPCTKLSPQASRTRIVSGWRQPWQQEGGGVENDMRDTTVRGEAQWRTCAHYERQMFCDSNNSANTGDIGLCHIVKPKRKAQFSLLDIINTNTTIFSCKEWKMLKMLDLIIRFGTYRRWNITFWWEVYDAVTTFVYYGKHELELDLSILLNKVDPKWSLCHAVALNSTTKRAMNNVLPKQGGLYVET